MITQREYCKGKVSKYTKGGWGSKYWCDDCDIWYYNDCDEIEVIE